jgi:hypothetical protein
MSWTNPAVSSVMQVEVETTSNRGHPPEFWARRCVERLIQVSDNAPPALREQARAFQKQIEHVVLLHVKRAIQSDRTTVGQAVTEAGHPSLAELIRRL